MTDPDGHAPALSEWAERELAARRAFWAALRDGGVVGVAEERESIGAMAARDFVATKWRIVRAEPYPYGWEMGSDLDL